MDKTHAHKTLTEAVAAGPKRNFKQSVDLIINLKDLDFKKPENQVDFYVTLQHGNGKTVRTCAFVGPELKDEAKAQVATVFGRVLGPRGKMPNPKAGCVVPPKAALKPLVERLQKTVRVQAKKDPVVHLLVGREDMAEATLVDNITFLYSQVQSHLPAEGNNIRNAIVKLSMGKPVKLQ
jgi:large subunit ribosomal protein L1